MAARLELQPGEKQIVKLRVSPLGTLPQYLFTLGLWEIWRRRKLLIITNHRVLVTRGILTNVQRSLPLDRIQDATVVRQFWWGSVRISTAGGTAGIETFGPAKLQQARDAAQRILASSSQYRGDGLSSAPPASTAEELTKLAQLHKQGVLTDDEFAAQKAKLLG